MLSEHWNRLCEIGRRIFLSTLVFIEQIRILDIAYRSKCGYQSNFIFLIHRPNRSPPCQHIDWFVHQIGWKFIQIQCQIIHQMKRCQQSNAVCANRALQPNKRPIKMTPMTAMMRYTNQSCPTCQTFRRCHPTPKCGRKPFKHTATTVTTVLSFAFSHDKTTNISVYQILYCSRWIPVFEFFACMLSEDVTSLQLKLYFSFNTTINNITGQQTFKRFSNNFFS